MRDGKTKRTTLGFDHLEKIDPTKFHETKNDLQIESIIAAEGVYTMPRLQRLFPNSKCRVYRSREGLDNMVRCRGEAPLTIAHPLTGLVETNQVVKGNVFGLHNIDVEVDGKKIRKTKGIANFWKRDPKTGKVVIQNDLLKEIKDGKRPDLSIGYRHDLIEEKGMFNGEEYDLREIDLNLDHIASVQQGTCTSPTCGLGLDHYTGIGLDPRHQDFEKIYGNFITRYKKKFGLKKAEAYYHGWLTKRGYDDSKSMEDNKKGRGKKMKGEDEATNDVNNNDDLGDEDHKLLNHIDVNGIEYKPYGPETLRSMSSIDLKAVQRNLFERGLRGCPECKNIQSIFTDRLKKLQTVKEFNR